MLKMRPNLGRISSLGQRIHIGQLLTDAISQIVGNDDNPHIVRGQQIVFNINCVCFIQCGSALVKNKDLQF